MPATNAALIYLHYSASCLGVSINRLQQKWRLYTAPTHLRNFFHTASTSPCSSFSRTFTISRVAMSKPPQKDDENESEYEIEGELQDVEGEPGGTRAAVDLDNVLSGRKQQKVSIASPETKKRFKARLFSLKNNRTKKANINLAGPANGSFDYEEMYDEDEYGKEAFPEARVWKAYNNETGVFDQERVDAWRDALDVLLVFIGLFSAIVTTFVVQTSQALQPDYAQMMVTVALEILYTVQNSTIPNNTLSLPTTDPRFGQAAPSTIDKVVNGLWFTSLAISLSTALLTVLTKQWLYHYTTSTSGTSRERARIRQFRYGGLEAYRVPLIIDLLPILLHLALALFLVGLTIFLSTLSTGIAGIVGSIMAVSYILYAISVYLPIQNPRCPYKSPLSFYAYWFYHAAMRRAKRIIAHPITTLIIFPARVLLDMCHALSLAAAQAASKAWRALQLSMSANVRIPRPTLFPVVSLYFRVRSHTSKTRDRIRSWALDKNQDPHPTLAIAETEEVRHGGSQLDVDALVYLYNNSSNSTARNIALESFCGLAPSDADTASVYKIVNEDLLAIVSQHTEIKAATNAKFPRVVDIPANVWRKVDRLLRALCVGDQGRPNWSRFAAGPVVCNPFRGAMENQYFFRHTLFPALFPSLVSPYQLFDISVAFAGCQRYELPLPVWALAIRVAFSLQPTDNIIRTILLGSPLNLSIDRTEMGAITMDVAMQSSSIRRLALEYLGILDAETEDLSLLFLSSFHNLLCEEEVTADSPPSKRFWRMSGLSPDSDSSRGSSTWPWRTPPRADLLTPLFDSLGHYCYWRWLFDPMLTLTPEEEEKLTWIRSIFELSFSPSGGYEISWKALLAAINALHIEYGYPPWAVRVVTPSWIHSVCHRFRPGPPPEDILGRGQHTTDEIDKEKDVIREAVWRLADLFLSCGEELAPSILYSIYKLDMLPTGIPTPEKRPILDLFWSPTMVQVLAFKANSVKHSRDSETEWFKDFLLLIHAPERLAFICRQLLLSIDALIVLCLIAPYHPIWPATFESLLLLIDDEAYLNTKKAWYGETPTQVRKSISEDLKKAKRILEKHHSILQDPRFSIPQFDDNDTEITSEQIQKVLDDILEDSAPLRSRDCHDPKSLLQPPQSSTMTHPIYNPQSHDSLSRPEPTTTIVEVPPVGLGDIGGSLTGTIHDERLLPASSDETDDVVDGSASPHVAVEMGGPTTNHRHLPLEGLGANATSAAQLQSAESDVERGEDVRSGRDDLC